MSQIPLRERKKQETREKLIKAAVSLAIVHGAAKVRIEDIAAAADVSPRTFSNYFPSKEAAMLDIALQIGKRITNALMATSSGVDVDSAVRSAILSEFPEVPRKDWLSQIILMYNDPDLLAEQRRADAQIEKMLAEAIAVREGIDEKQEIYPRLAATTLIATVHTAIQHWLNSQADDGFKETLEQALGRVSVSRQ